MSKVTPAGAPSWTRAATIDQYGGRVDKRNYLDRGPIDPLTDVGAENFARITSDLAAVTRTAPMFVMAFGTIVGLHFRGVSCVHSAVGVRWVSYDIGFAPPHPYPRVDRNGIGDYTISLRTQYTDDFGVTAPFAVSHVNPGSAIHTGVCRTMAEIIDGQHVRIRCAETDGAAVDPEGGITAVRIY